MRARTAARLSRFDKISLTGLIIDGARVVLIFNLAQAELDGWGGGNTIDRCDMMPAPRQSRARHKLGKFAVGFQFEVV
jgi:hypothetical protein